MSPASGSGYLSNPNWVSQSGDFARIFLRVDQCVCAVIAAGVLEFHLDCRQSEMTKPVTIHPFKIAQGTSRLSLSARTHT